MTVRVRFAPSPTGALHLGSARTALYNWLFARKHKGVFLLRVEDTDEARSTYESLAGILEGLLWLGLDWDEGPRKDWKQLPPEISDFSAWSVGPKGPYFQMGRLDLYRRYAEQLLSEGKAYRCYCSPQELEKKRLLALAAHRPPKYDGTCRNISPAEARRREAEGIRPVVRFRMPTEGKVSVEDEIRGRVEFANSELDDFVLLKANGIPTYQFAVVVDDHEMEISHVLRGDDHLSNTPRQIHLYQAFGWRPPVFAHISMIHGPGGGRLSKRHGAVSVQEYRDQGYLPEAMVNYLALLGWGTTESQEVFDLPELVEKFDLARCHSSPAVFDPQKLLWMNSIWCRKISARRLVEVSEKFWKPAFGDLDSSGRARLEKAVGLEQEKIKTLADIPRHAEIFFGEPSYDESAVNRILRREGVPALLEEVARQMEAASAELAVFDRTSLERYFRDLAQRKGWKTSQVFHPVRVAVSGRMEGPGLFEMLELLGRQECVKRIRACLQRFFTPAR